LLFLVVALIAGSLPAMAQTFPARPVRFVVPYPAGGPLALCLRLFTGRRRYFFPIL
jgi:tripartite-type tricarboxylate transporter receptor subunit TctC